MAASTMVLMPIFFAAGIAFWRLWYDLGSALTAEPATGSWSLIAGAVVYGLVAMCVVISYFVIVRRPRFLHAAVVLVGTTLPAVVVHVLPGV